jgi:hypothetical protein
MMARTSKETIRDNALAKLLTDVNQICFLSTRASYFPLVEWGFVLNIHELQKWDITGVGEHFLWLKQSPTLRFKHSTSKIKLSGY